MKKVLDKDLAEAIGEGGDKVVALLKELQDAGGLKVCQNVSKEDLAYLDIKHRGHK